MKVSQEILDLVPYQTGKPIDETKREYGLQEVHKLASNENPLGPSPKAVKAMQQNLADLHRYPDGACYDLSVAMSQFLNVPKDWVLFGNGSNETIDLLIRVFCEPGDAILTTQGAFVAYKICAQAARVHTQEIPVDHVTLAATGMQIAQAIREASPKVKLIFLANPNNPTGSYLNRRDMDVIVDALGTTEQRLLVIDEAYFELVRAADFPNGIDYLKKHKNIVVMRTMSKAYGLAGIRLGTMIARPEVNDLVNRVRNPFNVNSLAQVAGVAALQDVEFVKEVQNLTWSGLDYFYQELNRLGLPYLPSQGNFVLVDTLRNGALVTEAMLKLGVIVRPLGGYKLPRHIRISVGLENENTLAIRALEQVLKQNPI